MRIHIPTTTALTIGILCSLFMARCCIIAHANTQMIHQQAPQQQSIAHDDVDGYMGFRNSVLIKAF